MSFLHQMVVTTMHDVKYHHLCYLHWLLGNWQSETKSLLSICVLSRTAALSISWLHRGGWVSGWVWGKDSFRWIGKTKMFLSCFRHIHSISEIFKNWWNQYRWFFGTRLFKFARFKCSGFEKIRKLILYFSWLKLGYLAAPESRIVVSGGPWHFH